LNFEFFGRASLMRVLCRGTRWKTSRISVLPIETRSIRGKNATEYSGYGV